MKAIKKKVVSMRKIGPGAMVSLVVSLQIKQACMKGKQITAGQLTNPEGIPILL